MAIWSPVLQRGRGPLYVAIADAIARDVRDGGLPPGARLPPHRDLAYRLGVTPGTIARAYTEAERRGLVVGEVGRGTFVIDTISLDPADRRLMVPEQKSGDIIDLGLNLSAVGESEHLFRATLRELLRENDLHDMLEYQPAGGMLNHREAGAAWVARSGVATDAARVVVCNGAQHGLLVSLMSLASAGDTIATEMLTYPGMKALGHQLNLHLVGLPLDEEGLRPDLLEEVCRTRSAKALYCMPSLHNPTTTCMSESRVREIVRIAREFDLYLIEDDVYGFLLDDRPTPLAALAPERTIYISSASKSMAPGLRVGYLVVPTALVETVNAVARTTDWMTAPLMAEIARRWITGGSADALVDWHRSQAMSRQSITRRMLRGHLTGREPRSYHLWLPLPDYWRMDAFAAEALKQGVKVITAEAFAVRRDWPLHAVRLCLGAALSEDVIVKALTVLSRIIESRPRPLFNLI